MFRPMLHGQNRSKFKSCPGEHIVIINADSVELFDCPKCTVDFFRNQGPPSAYHIKSNGIVGYENQIIGDDEPIYSKEFSYTSSDVAYNNNGSFYVYFNSLHNYIPYIWSVPLSPSETPCGSALNDFTAFITIKYDPTTISTGDKSQVLMTFKPEVNIDLPGDVYFFSYEWIITPDKIKLQQTGINYFNGNQQIDLGSIIEVDHQTLLGQNKVIFTLSSRSLFINGAKKAQSSASITEDLQVDFNTISFFNSHKIFRINDGTDDDDPINDSLQQFTFADIRVYPRLLSNSSINYVTNEINNKYKIF